MKNFKKMITWDNINPVNCAIETISFNCSKSAEIEIESIFNFVNKEENINGSLSDFIHTIKKLFNHLTNFELVDIIPDIDSISIYFKYLENDKKLVIRLDEINLVNDIYD